MYDKNEGDLTVAGVALRFGIVGLDAGTAYIHSTLGGLLFTLNAIGYVVAAVAMIIPLALAIRFRWVVRLGLIGLRADHDHRLGDPGPVLLDRLHRQGDRGRADRPPRDRLRSAPTATRSRSSAARSPPGSRSSVSAAPTAPRPPDTVLTVRSPGAATAASPDAT